MRTYEEVKEKLLLLRDKYFKERCREYLSVKPINCIYYKKAKMLRGSASLCTANGDITECNSEICRKCTDFVCRNTEESVTADFNKILNSPSLCGNEYPKLAILLWFLQDVNPAVPKRKKFWFGRSR